MIDSQANLCHSVFDGPLVEVQTDFAIIVTILFGLATFATLLQFCYNFLRKKGRNEGETILCCFVVCRFYAKMCEFINS